MTDVNLTQEDYDATLAILFAERAAGNPNPLLPMDVDVDGDGLADSFGLDENDRVVIVTGTKLEDTLFESDGDDLDFTQPENGESADVGEPNPFNEEAPS